MRLFVLSLIVVTLGGTLAKADERTFAELNPDGTVKRVIVIVPEELAKGHWGDPATFVEAFRNGGKRKNYPGPGFRFDPKLDAFVPPKPFESWVLDEKTARWRAPVERPNGDVEWDEKTKAWKTP